MATGGTRRSPLRPPSDTLEQLAALALANAAEPASSRGRWIDSGSRSLVLLSGETAVRVARQPMDSSDLLRSQALIDQLPPLPFGVPRSSGGPARLDGYVAIPTRRLRGEPHEPGHGNPTELRQLLATIHGIDPEPIRPHLAEPRAYMGGGDWEHVLRTDVIPRLEPRLRREARSRVEELARLHSPDSTVNHGDLAGSNVLWSGGRVSAVLDWDLASIEDPAEDIAALAWWHGWSIIEELTDPTTVARARVFRRSFPLQAVAFSVIHSRPQDELRRTIIRAEEDLRTTGESVPQASRAARQRSDPS